MTVAFSGEDRGRIPEVSNYCFSPSYGIQRIQEVHATGHIIWDLVHIALGGEDVT